ncbi:MAG: dTDP-4-dehydrorhamnose 3,5-epimerase [Putridiphycobacter sp.]|nr:dTDP-4-dehydrorhamnose 3,5-epimerase [Putridiphycobacter sp.]
MEIERFNIDGVILFKPKVFRDERGYFFEAFNYNTFTDVVGQPYDFVQDNQSMSQKNTVRGLHFQKPPNAQGKLVSVVQGAVIDLMVDIRKNSKTYGKSLQVKLTGHEAAFLWVPPGFAHGFCTLEEDTIFQYKCTNYYHKASEGAIKWDDPSFGFKGLILEPIVSEKDVLAPNFKDFTSPF